jgi:magnesium transporter
MSAAEPETAPEREAQPGPMVEAESEQERRALHDAIEDALDHARLDEVERLILPLHAADLADLLEQLHPDDRRTIVGLIRPHLAHDPAVLAYLNEDVRPDVVQLLDAGELAQALGGLESDDALALIEDMDDALREAVMAELPTSARLLVEQSLTYPEYSAGRLMAREMVAVPMYWTVGKTIDFLRETEGLPDDFYMIFTVDPMFRPVGGVLLSRVLRAKRSVKLTDIMSRDFRTIPVDTDQEEVAYLFRQYGLVSAPVVEATGRLAGVITVDDVVDVIEEENEDDLLKLGGVGEETRATGIVETTRRRFTWLAVNLGTAVLASLVIGLFEATIAQVVALAVLMPIVASMGGNAGTQSLTITVRGLATRELVGRNARRMLVREVTVGALNGLMFAVIGGAVAYFWFGDIWIGVTIGIAMIITLLIAGLSGAVIPMLLEKLKIDPAVASGVFLTTVTDVVGFFAFLGLAAWIIL